MNAMVWLLCAGLLLTIPAEAPHNDIYIVGANKSPTANDNSEGNGLIPSVTVTQLQLSNPSVTAGELPFNDTTPILIPSATPTYPKAYPQSNKFSHEELDCERMAKEGQRLYGGSLVFLVGKDKNGAYITGDYAGHWLNRIYVPELKKWQYIDYQLKEVSDDVSDFQEVFEFSKGYPDSEVFDLGERQPPFGIIWHY